MTFPNNSHDDEAAAAALKASGGPALSGLRHHLLRIFGLGFGLAVVIGGVIGSGIMRNPSVVAAGFPHPALILIVWLCGGLFVAIDAMPTVELGAAIPLAGGSYALAVRAIGQRTGFVVGWADWLQLTISTGFITVAFGEYVHRLGLLPLLSIGQIAILLILGCGVVNWVGARTSGLSQSIGSALKGLGLVILVVLLFFAKGSSTVAHAAPMPAFSWIAALIALRAIYGAYGGWQAAVYFSEEVHAPERNVARATFGGIALVTALYVLVNAAVLHVLPMDVLTRSTFAAGDAANMVLGRGSGAVVTALAILCVATLANLQVMEQVRVTYAMARNGVLPPRLADVSESGTPRPALLVVLASTSLIIAGAELLKGQLYEILLNLYAPFAMFIMLLLAFAALKLRRAEPGLKRPWKMPLFPFPALLSMALNTILLVLFLVSDLQTGIWSTLLLLMALPIYAYGRARWR